MSYKTTNNTTPHLDEKITKSTKENTYICENLITPICESSTLGCILA